MNEFVLVILDTRFVSEVEYDFLLLQPIVTPVLQLSSLGFVCLFVQHFSA